ncbi:thioesterase family protein [Sediminibacillus halophilus]|uniref:Acyl-CoA thioester hydrolase n=1 Tax=Sediminibacillus halophilus TaxID=482461 RepID=A0A1G9NR19_9BACI|nr:thioesterase family protein [Sediminibacillus halophilus]SDL88487.1 acyl-CoA thioester hydrolase [Sediminibacillus halophilus]
MTNKPFHYQNLVHDEWVDYNGHMNDAAYAKAFSQAVDAFIDDIGLDEETRKSWGYTIFTLESHICYLQEAHRGQELRLDIQLLDEDAKRLHVFFTMKNTEGDLLATSEQMLMGINSEQGRPAPFPDPVAAAIRQLREAQQQLSIPKQAGRRIGIKR